MNAVVTHCSQVTFNKAPGVIHLAWRLVLVWAAGSWAVLLALFANHLGSPEITRGVRYEAIERILRGLPLYPMPSGEFVNEGRTPFFDLLGAVYWRVFGPGPLSLRLTAMTGTIGAGVIIFLAVRRETRSSFFGFLATGIFAGAYLAFDCYLDQANPDSWLLFCSLLGFYFLSGRRSVQRDVLAVALLCAAFWFKQHGAILALGGVLWLACRRGWRQSIPYWLEAALLGPFAYLLLGTRLFGEAFLYITFQVPASWSVLDLQTFVRYATYVARHFPFLFVCSAIAVYRWIAGHRKPNVWVFGLPFALLIGLAGSLDPGAENNNYILPSTWSILVAVPFLADLLRPSWKGWPVEGPDNRLPVTRSRVHVIAVVALALSLGMNAYDPREAVVPPEAWSEYHDLIDTVSGLRGTVYMPLTGQFAGDFRLPVPVHLVPLADLFRGQRWTERDRQLAKSILRDVVNPQGDAFILSNMPLEQDHLLAYLAPDYRLMADYGDRFRSLRGLPGRFSGQSWPRYLYAGPSQGSLSPR